MGNTTSTSAVKENDFKTLQETTTLTPGEITHLNKRFLRFTRGRRYLIKRDLYLVEDLLFNPIAPIIMNSMFGIKRRITFVEFAQYLHLFKAHSEIDSHQKEKQKRTEAKLQLLFDMYDTKKDGVITKDEIFEVVRRMYWDHLDYFDIDRLSKILMAEADRSGSNQILFEDFVQSLGDIDVDEKLKLRFPE